MKGKPSIYLLTAGLLLAWGYTLAQTSPISDEDWENATEEIDYPYTPSTDEETRPLTEEDWENSKGDLEYPDNTKPPPEKEPEDNEPIDFEPDSDGFFSNFGSFFANLGPLGKALLITLVIIGLAILIMTLLGNTPWQAKRKIRRRKAFTFDDFEEHINETDLERFLREALEASDHRSAIRVCYLMVIKSLSENELIKWQRDKTNYDYVREVRRRSFYRRFRDITHVFEVIWYGEAPINERIYHQLRPSFDRFISEFDEG